MTSSAQHIIGLVVLYATGKTVSFTLIVTAHLGYKYAVSWVHAVPGSTTRGHTRWRAMRCCEVRHGR